MGRKIRDITGERFGKLVVISYTDERRKGFVVWKCVCDCGRVCFKPGGNLLSGHVKSCGCMYRFGKGQAAFNGLFSSYKRRAKIKSLVWELTKECAKRLFESDCYYCGIKPNSKREYCGANGAFVYSGIDRVDSSKGYTQDNVVSCCKRCNLAKNDMTKEEYLALCRTVYEFNQTK